MWRPFAKVIDCGDGRTRLSLSFLGLLRPAILLEDLGRTILPRLVYELFGLICTTVGKEPRWPAGLHFRLRSRSSLFGYGWLLEIGSDSVSSTGRGLL